jgi:hypothetical protein
MSANDMPRGIAAKLAAVQADTRAARLAEESEGQYGHYTSKEALQDAIRPVLAEHGVALICSCTKQWDEGSVMTKSGALPLTRVEVMGTFLDSSTGEQFTVAGQGAAADSGDKALYKAQTSAIRYMLMQSLLISTVPVADVEQDRHERASAEEMRQLGEQIAKQVIDLAARKGADVAAVQAAIDDHRNRFGYVDVEWIGRQRSALQARPDVAANAAQEGAPAGADAAQGSTPAPSSAGAEEGAESALAGAAAAAAALADDPLAAMAGATPLGPTDEQQAKLAGIVQEIAKLRPDQGTADQLAVRFDEQAQKQYEGRHVVELSPVEATAFIEYATSLLLKVREQTAAKA